MDLKMTYLFIYLYSSFGIDTVQLHINYTGAFENHLILSFKLCKSTEFQVKNSNVLWHLHYYNLLLG